MINIDIGVGLVLSDRSPYIVCVFRKRHLDSIRACALGWGIYYIGLDNDGIRNHIIMNLAASPNSILIS